ncbi:hypothetical protein [Thiocapsa bogorovii]|uniref:hypothetical protein n=1 Tax=Thiocapsa bogorovii TaxID=521689 RepID=UPI001E47D4C2|nr:hypothetical protein [Thiocapsa bogorovii]UHD17836.1 hypothetical protein LT988_07245 [Thiocapsa bogorovii]
MRRRTRIHIDGLPLHIVQRGHNDAACFFDDQDRLAYLGWLHEAPAGVRGRVFTLAKTEEAGGQVSH